MSTVRSSARSAFRSAAIFCDFLRLADGRLALEELHRFPNTPIKVAGSLCWNIPALIEGLKTGLKQSAVRRLPIASISTDSWGVDYLLLDAQGEIIPPVFHYRDPRTACGVASV
ncbi:MAG: rhamnulokinase, partial [Rhizobiales bacterium]|nr:rhamnulokinase [Hyphomicrobiales bacterium]